MYCVSVIVYTQIPVMNQQRREMCYKARNAYFECLQHNNNSKSKCGDSYDKFCEHCPSAWVSEFIFMCITFVTTTIYFRFLCPTMHLHYYDFILITIGEILRQTKKLCVKTACTPENVKHSSNLSPSRALSLLKDVHSIWRYSLFFGGSCVAGCFA